MSRVADNQKSRARPKPLVRWLGAVNTALRRPINHDVAAGHIEFAQLVERSLLSLGLAERDGQR